MANKEKVTVTLDGALLQSLDLQAQAKAISRSQLVEEALRFWQAYQLEEALKNGYAAMSEEALEWAETSLSAGSETWT